MAPLWLLVVQVYALTSDLDSSPRAAKIKRLTAAVSAKSEQYHDQVVKLKSVVASEHENATHARADIEQSTQSANRAVKSLRGALQAEARAQNQSAVESNATREHLGEAVSKIQLALDNADSAELKAEEDLNNAERALAEVAAKVSAAAAPSMAAAETRGRKKETEDIEHVVDELTSEAKVADQDASAEIKQRSDAEHEREVAAERKVQRERQTLSELRAEVEAQEKVGVNLEEQLAEVDTEVDSASHSVVSEVEDAEKIQGKAWTKAEVVLVNATDLANKENVIVDAATKAEAQEVAGLQAQVAARQEESQELARVEAEKAQVAQQVVAAQAGLKESQDRVKESKDAEAKMVIKLEDIQAQSAQVSNVLERQRLATRAAPFVTPPTAFAGLQGKAHATVLNNKRKVVDDDDDDDKDDDDDDDDDDDSKPRETKASKAPLAKKSKAAASADDAPLDFGDA